MWYEVGVVLRGYEEIKILTGDNVDFEGCLPPIQMVLTFGQTVMVKQDGHYRKRYTLEVIKEIACISFGGGADPADYDAYINLSKLHPIMPDNKNLQQMKMNKTMKECKTALHGALKQAMAKRKKP